MGETNIKSDVRAKQAYKKYLEGAGFVNVRVTSAPADITAEKEGEIHYFEIKMTRQKESYFGAATMTEWKAALDNPDNFKFVIAELDEDDYGFEFIEFSPDEFLRYSTIPPFKVYFNVDLKDYSKTNSGNKAVRATKETLREFIAFFEGLQCKS